MLCKNKGAGKSKGWVSKQFKHVKKFVKKHKTAVIIGAVVVAAATIVVCAVVATSAAGVAAATGAARSSATAAGLSNNKEKDISTSGDLESSAAGISAIGVTDETPIFKESLQNEISTFKENIAKEQFFNLSNNSTQQRAMSLEENGRATELTLSQEEVLQISNRIPLGFAQGALLPESLAKFSNH